MPLTETSIDTASSACETESGYLWYICTWTAPFYSGCCRVNPCRQEPIGCPPQARGDSESYDTTVTLTTTVPSSTLTVTKTRSKSQPAPSSSATPTPGASAASSPTISSTSTANNDNINSHGLAISTSALVGIVVGCGIVVIFAALMACMWWGRRRREKDEKRDHAARLGSSRGLDEDQVPPGLESVFNPMTQSGPAASLEALGREIKGANVPHLGRMAKADSMLGFSPLAHDPRQSTLSSGAHSGIVSPLTPGSSWGLGLPSSPSELDSTPVHREMTRSGDGNQGNEMGSHPGVKDGADIVPRATLNSTEQERETGTYANSWTRFQDVQL
ncbi:hypothetical protein C8A01DRAFT_46150 [Parachaetomium inaequale]|uniref:Uncharacterized protein n=1 Tax=Parachaetomium inaequale TaxID=2588326 RepID=A0AAN6PGW6_9PEZI|nr:hypothetical protein C8A01DRAFT_46150 [Parachaetomium inaequale]